MSKISRQEAFHTDWRNIWQDFCGCSNHNWNGHKQLNWDKDIDDEKYKDIDKERNIVDRLREVLLTEDVKTFSLSRFS